MINLILYYRFTVGMSAATSLSTSELPSIKRQKVEAHFKTASEGLQKVLLKEKLTHIELFPTIENKTSVDIASRAAELEAAIDKVGELKNASQEDQSRTRVVKEIVRKWFQASYPFVQTFLKVANTASQVWTYQIYLTFSHVLYLTD